MSANEVWNLRNSTHVNAMLKKLLVERNIEAEIMKEIAAAPACRIAALCTIERGASHHIRGRPQVVIEDRYTYFNCVRPHLSVNYETLETPRKKPDKT